MNILLICGIAAMGASPFPSLTPSPTDSLSNFEKASENTNIPCYYYHAPPIDLEMDMEAAAVECASVCSTLEFPCYDFVIERIVNDELLGSGSGSHVTCMTFAPSHGFFM